MELPRYGVDCSTVKGPRGGRSALATLGSVTSGKQQLESAPHRTAQRPTGLSFTFALVSTTYMYMYILYIDVFLMNLFGNQDIPLLGAFGGLADVANGRGCVSECYSWNTTTASPLPVVFCRCCGCLFIFTIAAHCLMDLVREHSLLPLALVVLVEKNSISASLTDG